MSKSFWASTSCVLKRLCRNASSLKSTWWPSKSGPSTQANFTLPSTVTRQEPHMPVPSTMIAFRLTIVLTPNGRLVSAQARIIGSGPIATISSTLSFSRTSLSAAVTKPGRPYEPSSVQTISSSQNSRNFASQKTRSFERKPMIPVIRLPASLKARS